MGVNGLVYVGTTIGVYALHCWVLVGCIGQFLSGLESGFPFVGEPPFWRFPRKPLGFVHRIQRL